MTDLQKRINRCLRKLLQHLAGIPDHSKNTWRLVVNGKIVSEI